MKTKVLLINSPTHKENNFISSRVYFPYGLLSIATFLNKKGIETRIIDINNYFSLNLYSQEALFSYIDTNLIKEIDSYRPDIIGIGSLFSGSFNNLIKISTKIKASFNNIPIVIGGIHTTIFVEEILNKYKSVDYVILGEGEYTFFQLVSSLKENKSINNINGLAFRDNNIIIKNDKTKFINNLDELPFVDYSLVNINNYKTKTDDWFTPKNIKVGQPFPIFSSRSCPFQCPFCSMWMVHGKKFRQRSAQNVVNEMEYLYNNYNTRFFDFYDDNLILDKKRAIEIFSEIIKRNLNIQFDTPSGLSMKMLDKEIVDVMVEAGLSRINLAIESGDDYIRNTCMRKNVSTEKIYEIMNHIAKYEKLFIVAYFIIGMPQETHESLNATYQMILDLPIDESTISYATPYPGTELFEYCINNNLLTNPKEYYLDIADFQYLSSEPHFEPHNVTKQELITFRGKCLSFYKNKRTELNLPFNVPLRYLAYKNII